MDLTFGGQEASVEGGELFSFPTLFAWVFELSQKSNEECWVVRGEQCVEGMGKAKGLDSVR